MMRLKNTKLNTNLFEKRLKYLKNINVKSVKKGFINQFFVMR